MTAPAPAGSTAAATLVVGEALADVVVDADGERAHPGGSPANTALGLARLGHRVELATRFGRDAYGELLRQHLTRSGVVLAPGSVSDGPTSTARAFLDEHGSAAYRFDIAWDPAPLRPPAVPGHVHTGSVATALEPGASRSSRSPRRPGPRATPCRTTRTSVRRCSGRRRPNGRVRSGWWPSRTW
ncbi:PfkB family carbohydrate kinase [Streptomyces sp. NPDC046977]|uniref:carbohydrate kinase family protein n=1 Tax=Streptomyces sp. NPDC046977 TaxID=3154703 RepID=UPI0033EE551E